MEINQEYNFSVLCLLDDYFTENLRSSSRRVIRNSIKGLKIMSIKLNHKKIITTALFLLSTSLCSSAAMATGVGVSLKASTLGVGLELSSGLSDNVNIRVGANYFKLSKTLEESGTDYDFDLKMKSFTALLDWHVFKGGFRLTAGAVLDKNRLDGVAQQSASYDIGDNIYSAAAVGTLSASVNFRNLSPYLGIGWGNAVKGDSNWTFVADLGVIFTGTPRVDIRSSIANPSAALLADIAMEEQSVSDDIDFFKFYPVISIGMAYRF